MNIFNVKKIGFLIFVLILLTGSSCRGPQLPALEYPVESKGVFSASFDEVWAAAIEVAKISFGGTLITADKSSGLICYKRTNLYINVHIKKYLDSDSTTVVYIYPWHRTGPYITADQPIYTRKARIYNADVESRFFYKLESKLEGK